MADNSPAHLYPTFRQMIETNVLPQMVSWCQAHYPECDPQICEGFRSTARQQELYAQGRTVPGQIVTQRSGLPGHESNHQSALAVDIVPKVDGEFSWDVRQEFWEYLGHVARANGLTWGGDWEHMKDLPHVEWPQTDHATYAAAQDWIANGFGSLGVV